MAYVDQTVASLAGIPAAVAAIAVAQGWDVDSSTPSQPIFTLPTTDPSIDFRLSVTISGVDHAMTWTAEDSEVPTSTASIHSPKLAPPSGTTADTQIPNKIHVFISPAPSDAPYLAIVIEYGTNLFRHLYLGSMEKLGNYGGGEVVSGCTAYLASSSGAIGYKSNAYLFNSFQAVWAEAAAGGVHVHHADNAEPWRVFRANNPQNINNMPGNAVTGGYLDATNDGYVIRGKSPFAGVNILTPINLYASRPVTGGMDIVPIGHPPGVRHVHMEDIGPGAEFTLGSKSWKVFPALSKNTSQSGPPGPGNWRVYESSYYLGYAYPMN